MYQLRKEELIFLFDFFGSRKDPLSYHWELTNKYVNPFIKEELRGNGKWKDRGCSPRPLLVSLDDVLVPPLPLLLVYDWIVYE